MVKSQEKAIEYEGERFTFYVNQLPAMPALQMKIRLLKVLGPSITELIKSLGGKGVRDRLADQDISGFAPVIESLAGTLDPEVFGKLCLDLFKGVQVIGAGKKHEPEKEEGFNTLFSGRIPLMYQGLLFVLQVNDFFGLGAIGKALFTKKAPTPGSTAPAGV